MKNVNVNTFENVKGIESKIKSFSSFYHVALFNISHLPKRQEFALLEFWGFLHQHLNLTVLNTPHTQEQTNAQLALMCNIRKENPAKNFVYM